MTNPVGFDPPVATNPTLINVALRQPVAAAGETWPGASKESLTDGDLNTFTHNNTPASDFSYLIDLGATFKLENVEVWNRKDGCCPERLTQYSVSILADAGSLPGGVVWTAQVRTNGSNSGVGGRDTLIPSLDAQGVFAGRWIRIQARPTLGDRYFQIAEVRAHAANWTRGATVEASGDTFGALPKENIIDGNTATFSHNLTPNRDFSYRIRLTESVALSRIDLLNRTDGCCPDRLSRFRVRVHPDVQGAPGSAQWTADLRIDGSNSGVEGVDSLVATLNPGGTFEGQWITIQNLDSGSDRYLQLAEVRVFGIAGSLGYRSSIRSDVASVMKDIRSSAWVRYPFHIASLSNLEFPVLRVRYDDGFAAYLNGQEIARANAPALDLPYDAAALTRHLAGTKTEFPLATSTLREGTNILALHVLNQSASDPYLFNAVEVLARRTRLGNYGYLLTASPGSLNASNTVSGFVSTPEFSLDRGFFTQPIELTLLSPTPGATLVYTTNSSRPSLTNGVVIAPSTADAQAPALVTLARTTILRAAAFKTGFQTSPIRTHTYLFLNDVIRQPSAPLGFPATWNGFAADYQMDPEVVTNAVYASEIIPALRSIPTLSMVLQPSELFGTPNGIYIFPENIGDTWERAASIELILPDGTTGFQENCGVRIWGTGWRPHSSSPKHAIQVKFQDQYGVKKLRYPIFPDAPVAEFDNLVLRAQGSRSWADFRQPDIQQTQFIHDSWARDTAHAMGKLEGHATYVHLYLNGLYWGLYNPVEKTDEGFAEAYYGGDKSEYDVITRRGEPEVDAGDLTAWNQMMAIVNSGLATAEKYAQVQQFLDVDDLIDYMMIHQYASNHDGPTTTLANNMRAIRRRAPTGQFRFHVWDMEYTFWYPLENNLGFDLDQSPARIFQRLRANAEFRLRFADHAHRHLRNDGALTPGPSAARWQARANQIYSAVVAESARWGDVRRPSPPYTRDVEWKLELNRLLNEYFPIRAQIYLDQLRAAGLYPSVEPPAFSQNGGDIAPGFSLGIQAPAGTVYFTTNGLDPRLPGGFPAPEALAFVPVTRLVPSITHPAKLFLPTTPALGTRWNGTDPNFSDVDWIGFTNPAGFDATSPLDFVTVVLTNATADFSENGRLAQQAIDANPLTTGWGLFEQQDYLPKGRGAIAVFETAQDLGFPEGTRLTIVLQHRAAGSQTLGKFRFSVTTDDRDSFADSAANRGDITAQWTPLTPLTAAAGGGTILTPSQDGSILASGPNPSTNSYTLTYITSLTGITGLRLEAMEDSSLPSNGPGRSGTGNALLTDLSIRAAPGILKPLVDPAASASLQASMRQRTPSAYVRYPFQVASGARFDSLALRIRYLDGFIAYLNGHEIARRNAPESAEWNSTALANRPSGQALDFESIELRDAAAFVVPGPNLLAVHAFNHAIDGPEFLIQAELLGRAEFPLALFDNTTVKARALLDSQWSALQESTFVSRFPLRITEIMYSPPGSSGGGADEFEFLELKNEGASALTLTGMRFLQGIDFAFVSGSVLAPGQFVVLVRNPTQFATRYPGIPIYGTFLGKLNNDGEALSLGRTVDGIPLLSLVYGATAPWPIAANGLGFSLVPRARTELNSSAGSQWRSSSAVLGSPGSDDPDPAIPAVVINEVRAATTPPSLDAIEVLNPTQATADLAGWYLTDDPAVPKKFTLPVGSILPAGGTLVFDEGHFNSGPDPLRRFQLNEEGDSVYLFSAGPNGELTGHSHGFSFSVTLEGDTAGRHLISTGEERFPTLTAPTLGAPNSAPRVGPVVISEIQYHPLPGTEEFVELKNISDQAVPLFDPGQPTHTWRLSGLNYSLPPAITLPAGGILLVVPVDPQQFRSRFSIPPGTLLAGPYLGRLQDGGETLSLQSPHPTLVDPLRYIDLDAVRFTAQQPWPELAAGSGPSLHRVTLSSYADDPANWTAASPSPGLLTLAGVPPSITQQPASLRIPAFSRARFSVTATGSAPFQYQWRFGNELLSAATNSEFTLPQVQPNQAGQYSVTIFNSAGAVSSTTAMLQLVNPPVLTSQPQGRVVAVGSNLVLSVTAQGTGRLAYQWRLNQLELAGAVSPTLALPQLREEQSGVYDVVVTDSVGSIVSQPALLTVLARPRIVEPPLDAVAVVGDTLTFRVVAAGTPPLTYRWQFGRVVLTNIVAAGPTSRFTLFNLQAGQAGSYSVAVGNGLPSITDTRSVQLIVLSDRDGDHVPDEWESRFALNPDNPADALLDPDQDQMSTLSEYIAGTDPTDSRDVLKLEVVLAEQEAALSFATVSNKSYTLEYRDSLNALSTEPWGVLSQFPPRPASGREQVRDSLGSERRYYRLLTPAKQ